MNETLDAQPEPLTAAAPWSATPDAGMAGVTASPAPTALNFRDFFIWDVRFEVLCCST